MKRMLLKMAAAAVSGLNEVPSPEKRVKSFIDQPFDTCHGPAAGRRVSDFGFFPLPARVSVIYSFQAKQFYPRAPE